VAAARNLSGAASDSRESIKPFNSRSRPHTTSHWRTMKAVVHHPTNAEAWGRPSATFASERTSRRAGKVAGEASSSIDYAFGYLLQGCFAVRREPVGPRSSFARREQCPDAAEQLSFLSSRSAMRTRSGHPVAGVPLSACPDPTANAQLQSNFRTFRRREPHRKSLAPATAPRARIEPAIRRGTMHSLLAIGKLTELARRSRTANTQKPILGVYNVG